MTHTTTAKAVRRGLLAAVAVLVACAAAPAGAASAHGPGDWLYVTVAPGEARPPQLRPEGPSAGAVRPGNASAVRPADAPAVRSGDPRAGDTEARARHSGDVRAALLRCDPPQGHPRAAEACAQLDRAGGDLRAVPAENTFCTMVHAPVTARARGQWNGKVVAYEETFSNACVMTARTGAVFALEG